MKTLRLLARALAISTLAGCAAIPNIQMYEGDRIPDEATIETMPLKDNPLRRHTLSISKVDDTPTQGFWAYLTHGMTGPTHVSVKPGPHKIRVEYVRGGGSAGLTLQLIAGPGGRYMINSKSKMFSVRVWITDLSNSAEVGSSEDTTPDAPQPAVPTDGALLPPR